MKKIILAALAAFFTASLLPVATAHADVYKDIQKLDKDFKKEGESGNKESGKSGGKKEKGAKKGKSLKKGKGGKKKRTKKKGRSKKDGE